jgi:hypothetical protein
MLAARAISATLSGQLQVFADESESAFELGPDHAARVSLDWPS